MVGHVLSALFVSAVYGDDLGNACPSSGVSEDEVSMLQARVAPTGRLHAPQTSVVHEKTQVMLASVTQLAKQMSGDVTVLETLQDEVEEMMALVQEQAATDRAIVNGQFAEIEACLATYPIAGRVSAVETLCSQCSTCETERVSREENRIQVCDQWNTFANGLWTQMVGACQHSPSFLEEPRTGENCHAGLCSRQGSEEVHQIALAMQFWEVNFAEMQEKRSACTSACASGTCIACDDHSQQFEEAYCSFHQHCGMLATCHAHESALYDEQIERVHVADTPGLNTIQQESYLMHEQILCIVGLIQDHYPTNDTISDASLDSCSPAVLRAIDSVSDKLEELDIPRRTASPLPECSPPSCHGSCPAAATPQCPEVATPVTALSLTSSTGDVYINAGPLQEGSIAWTDRDYTLQNVPAEMLGATYFQGPVFVAAQSELTFQTPDAGTLYIWSDLPVAGWDARDGGFANLPGWARLDEIKNFNHGGASDFAVWKREVMTEVVIPVTELLVGGVAFLA